jgi:hypothetical protein
MSCSVATKALSLKIAVLTAVVGAGLAVLSQPVAAQDAGVDALAPKLTSGPLFCTRTRSF